MGKRYVLWFFVASALVFWGAAPGALALGARPLGGDPPIQQDGPPNLGPGSNAGDPDDPVEGFECSVPGTPRVLPGIGTPRGGEDSRLMRLILWIVRFSWIRP